MLSRSEEREIYEEERRKQEAYQRMLVDPMMNQINKPIVGFQGPQQVQAKAYVAKANEGVSGE